MRRLRPRSSFGGTGLHPHCKGWGFGSCSPPFPSLGRVFGVRQSPVGAGGGGDEPGEAGGRGEAGGLANLLALVFLAAAMERARLRRGEKHGSSGDT